MGVYVILLVFLLGLGLFAYYIYIIMTGKRLARLVGSKDRYIWNGLKNISQKGMPFAGKRNTIFLDHDNLVISNEQVVSILRELRQTDGLAEAVVVPFHRIVSFDYNRSVDDWNVVVRFLLGLWNRLLKKNDYHLSVRYLDADQSIQQFMFKANSMDVNDFEATFADFDNQIYSGKVRYEAEHGNLDQMIARSPDAPVAIEEDSPTVAISSSELPEVLQQHAAREHTEELPVMTEVEAEPEAEAVVVAEEAVVVTEEPAPEISPAEAENDLPAANEEDFERSETIQPVRRSSRNWFEEEYLPRKKQAPVEAEAVDAEATVMISREELMKKDVIFERPDNQKDE